MKNSWIKTSNKMPDLHFISPDWYISESVLIYVEDGFYFGHLNIREGITQWNIEAKPSITDINTEFYWQYFEKPNGS